LTGGIGAGKSTVAELFTELGAEVIDADAIAREVVAPGTPLLAAVAAAFGHDLIADDGTLDRRRLRERVFSAPRQRQRLERLLHPAIRAELETRAAAARGPYVVAVIPLLLEGDGYPWIDRVLVVDSPAELRIQRVTRRDGCDQAMVRAIMNSQLDGDQRLLRADDLLINDGDIKRLRDAVYALDEDYRRRAADQRLRPTPNECDHC